MRKAIRWETIGDLRCPCCGRYSRLKSTGGKGKEILQLECKTTGETYVRPLNGYWIKTAEVNQYVLDIRKLRREERMVLRYAN